MDALSGIWDRIGAFFSALLGGVERTVTAVFGSSNARAIKKLESRVEAINALESQLETLSNEELKGLTAKFRERIDAGETLDGLLIEAFAACREAGKRFLNMRHYDVQLIGGMVLHSGCIAEMVTGEGKTLVATLPAYLNALTGDGVHVVTVNDYLARRDMEWMAPLYLGLGITVGAIQSDMETDDRQAAYSCDITYGTNNEFGFDYLRDNMRPAARGDDRYDKFYQQSQGKLVFAIVDEVDNILIDEARTPLIISGSAHDDIRKYAEADKIARQLKKEKHFKVNEKDHSAHMTDEGVREAERLAGVESFYTAGNMDWPHLLDNSLKAHHLYKRDVNYVVRDDSIIIVDEFTGRLMDGRQWSDGLHQAVEAKERVKIKEETQTLATITLQNFFKLYKKVCGMTGTALTEASEFWKIYKLDVVAIPTNRPLQRLEHPDVIYLTEKDKYVAVAEEIERLVKWDVLVIKNREYWGTIKQEKDTEIVFEHQDRKTETIAKSKIDDIERKGRPVLVGTVSIEKSERLSSLLNQRGIKHEVLNAKYHQREAEIVAQAGRKSAVTIATNMAGRGTDIVLGGNAETMAWARLQQKYETRLDVPQEEWNELVREIETKEQMREMGEEVKSLGGLHVVATERHEARRIDLQLRGRTGRQGDPGSSRFFLSLEDDLMRIFAGPWVKSWLERFGMNEGERIESRMVTRRIETAQKKVEERNFEIRKNLLEYDEVMDEQRKRVYRYRQAILDGGNCRDLILDSIQQQIDWNVDRFMQRDYGVDSFAAWAGDRLSVQLEGRDFRGLDMAAADVQAKDEAERMSETIIIDGIEENLPEGDDTTEWNWASLAKMVNQRWELGVRDRDLKKQGREQVSEFLIQKVRGVIQKMDLSDGEPFLEEQYGLKTAIDWVHNKFGFTIDFEEVRDIEEAREFKDIVYERAIRKYDEKESEYPVIAGLYRFSQNSNGRIDRETLVGWAKERFDESISVEDFRNMQRDEIRDVLLDHSRQSQSKANDAIVDVRNRVDTLFGDAPNGQTAGVVAGGNGTLDSLSNWLQESFRCDLPVEKVRRMDRRELESKMLMAVEDRFRPEMRRLERSLLLDIVDNAWKDHLLVMDHLKSSIGLVGYAQMDAKVEYKRDGMRMYEEMWNAIGERTTDLIFKIEHEIDDEVVDQTFDEGDAIHDDASSVWDDQLNEIDNQSEQAVETIRNRGERVGRNEPCPCNSGKKYKNCCMRKSV